jgi:hypothetical protein
VLFLASDESSFITASQFMVEGDHRRIRHLALTPGSPKAMDPDSSRPIIGITCYVEEAVRGVWESMPHALSPYNYVTKVERAGGIALLIPPRVDADAEMARAVVARLDGLMLAGGVDVETPEV